MTGHTGRRAGLPLQRSATPDEQTAILEWIRAHGIDPDLIPVDGISIDPGEGWTRITWQQIDLNEDGKPTYDRVTHEPHTSPHEKIVRGLPPFAVIDGAKVPPTRQ